MTGFFELTGPTLGPAAGGKPSALVILLHGLGADGNDLIGLAPYWAEALRHVRFIAPHAPFPCDMAPYGRQWFSLQDRAPGMILAGVEAAAPILDAFIDAELSAYGLGDERVALVGFSQGTMMSLFVAPRRARPLAAVLGYSGALVGAERILSDTRSRPPVMLVHGDADPVVPFQAMAAAQSALSAAGFSVVAERRPGLGHSIDEIGVNKGAAFLARHLPAVR